MVDALEALSKPGESSISFFLSLTLPLSLLLEHLQQLYAFSFHPREPASPCIWQFRSTSDLFRQWQCSSERFRISTVNKGFKVCSSYPEEVIVPSSVSDEDLIKVVCFSQMVCLI